MAKYDLIFIHAPSVYDFRKESLFYGPVSDLVPSTPVFEMYPFGFTTMAAHLSKAGYKVRIINLASMMLNDNKLDVEAFLSKLDATVFGIDLHWLPHAHGSLAIAEILKKQHPQAKILFGGFSSSYFQEELIQYPQVDLVMRGDSVEPAVVTMMDTLSKGGDLSKVPNLTWKENGKVRINEMSFIPEDLDYLDIDYAWIIKSVIKTMDMEGAKPFKDWDRYPLTVAFTVRGCAHRCAVCGGSCGANKLVVGRSKPAFRSPEKVAQDISNVENYLKAPVFVVGDLRQQGESYAERFFKECKRLDIDTHVILEYFVPPPESFFKAANATFSRYSIQFSPDSHEENVRYALGRKFDNYSMNRSIGFALQNGCQRFDMFFMIGLPEQTPESAISSAEYTKKLYNDNNNDSRLHVYTSPLAPFLDPGSFAFENPEKYGYKLLAHTLEEHRVRLTNPSWKDVLSYETRWMNRDQIAQTSYDAADLLSKVRLEVGHISQEEYAEITHRSQEARELLAEVEVAVNLADPTDRQAALAALKTRSLELMESTICQKRDLEWDTQSVFRSAPRVVKGLIFKKKKK